MRKALFLGFISLVLLAAGCTRSAAVAARDDSLIVAQGGQGPVPWTSLAVNDGPDYFRFAVVADKQGGERPGVFAEAVAKLNYLQPEFVMCVGDLIHGLTEDMEEVRKDADNLDATLKPLEMPFFYLVGNHDISNAKMMPLYIERRGRSYYDFTYRNVLFLCLNTEDPPDTNISAEQIDYAARTLDASKGVRWTFVFMHKPLWAINKDSGWARLEALLKDRPHTVFAGHNHTFEETVRNGNRYFMLATTGGASDLSGPAQGKFDHIVWVTMTPKGPRFANLMLSGIWGENVREEAAKAQQK